MDEKRIGELIRTALQMRERSYCPYSRFAVGAALLTGSGRIYTGCNIENAAFSPTCCAERTAVFKAVSEGETDFRAIAVAGGRAGEEPAGFCTPCGVCRQVLAEFVRSEDFPVIMAVSPDNYRISTLAGLLPGSFGAEMMETESGA